MVPAARRREPDGGRAVSRLDALLAGIIRRHDGPARWLALRSQLVAAGLSESHAEDVLHYTPLLKQTPDGYLPLAAPLPGPSTPA